MIDDERLGGFRCGNLFTFHLYSLLIDFLRQGGDGGRIEEVTDGNANVIAVFDAGQQADDQERVAAQRKEIILDSDFPHSQQRPPDSRQLDLQGRNRRAAGWFGRNGSPIGLGQGAAVDLALAGEGQLGQGYKGRGDHVGGQAIKQPGP